MDLWADSDQPVEHECPQASAAWCGSLARESLGADPGTLAM
jgi:hypothetical protein